MDAKQRAAPTRVYQDFEPSTELVSEEDCDTLLLYLPGFRKELLKVQLAKTRILIISGERATENNIWSRFQKEFPLSTNCDIDKLSAKFEGSILYIRQPKVMIVVEKPPSEAQKPTEEPQPQNNAREQASSMTYPAEQKNERTNDLASDKNVPDKVLETGELMDAKNISENPAEKEKIDGSTVSEKSVKEEKGGIDGKTKRNRDDDASDSDNNGRKTDGATRDVDNSSGKARQGMYRPAATRLAPILTMPRKVMNMVMVVLLVTVLGLYVTNLFRYWTKTEN